MCAAIFPNVPYIRASFKGNPRNQQHLRLYQSFLHNCAIPNFSFLTHTKKMRDANTRDAILVQTAFKDAFLAESGLLNVSDPSKFVKYSGLFFNELDRPVDFIENVRVSLEPDLWRGGYCFTDGCGKISLDLIKTLMPECTRESQVPSVLQIRAPGIKGILVADATLPERTIQFRKSMQKLDVMRLKTLDPSGKSHELVMKRMPLAVIGSSKLTRCSGLNSQALALLIERGLVPEIVHKKDKQYKNALMHALVDVDSALDFLYICGYDAEFAKLIEILNLEHTRKAALQRFWSELQNLRSFQISCWLRRGHKGLSIHEPDSVFQSLNDFSFDEGDPLRRLYLPIRDSYNLFGVCDEVNVLMPGQCYINVCGNDGKSKTVTGMVAVFRNPCYHPGDIILLEAVNQVELCHLTNLIVFSTAGKRPAADMCAGGDLDGDKFHCIWDTEIIACLKPAQPFDYRPDSIQNCILETFAKLGVQPNNNPRTAQKRRHRNGTEHDTTKNALIESLTSMYQKGDKLISNVDSLLLEFQKFETIHAPENPAAILTRAELMNLLTALFSASVDALSLVDQDSMLKVVRNEIMNSRTSTVSAFRKVHEACLQSADTAASGRLRTGAMALFPLFYASTRTLSTSESVAWWQDPIQIAAFKPREEPHHVDLTMRLLNLGRQTQNQERVVTSLLGRAELMGTLAMRVSPDLVSLCVQVVSGLESVIEEHLASFQVLRFWATHESNADAPIAVAPGAVVVAAFEKRQAELDKLLSRHESFAAMISSVADMINAYAVQMDTPIMLALEKVLRNEIGMLQTELPIYSSRNIIIDSIENNRATLILSETGSGKSTCTPNFIANTLFFQNMLSPSKQVLVAQPRRNATTSLAERLALSRSSKISEQVGFHIGKTRARTNKDRTILTCVTYGILLAYARKDAYLRGFSVVILDEVHENSADLHFLFGILKHALRVNLELKLVLMSASVDFTKMTRFFNGCATVHVDGRSHPVEEEFVGNLSFNRAEYVRDAVFQCIRIHEQNDVPQNGDILVFLPTVQDINDAVKLISEFAKKNEKYRNLRAFPLFSSMSEERKQFILNRLPIEEWGRLNTSHDRLIVDFEAEEGEWDLDEGDFFMYENDDGEIVQFIPEKKKSRRVIFCTNIAETSLTIPSIGYVVDCGLQYSVEHSPIMRIVDSKLVPTTKVSAVQRMGRAGRLGPGKCIRMYSFEEQGELVSQAYSSPKNFDLRMLHIIETFKDIRNFEWFKQPLDAELAWTYSVLIESGFLQQSPTSHHQQITRDGEFALDLGRLEIPANIALFILNIWRATCNGQHDSIRNHCLTIAAFLAVGSRKVFQNRYLYSKLILDGYFELVKYPDERVLPSSFSKVNLYNIWMNVDEPLRDKFCAKYGIIPRGMYTIHDLRDELQRFMFEKSGFIAETKASEQMGRLSTVPEGAFEKLEFILGHLASACFTHIGYKTNDGDVLFICDSKTERAEIERMEEDSFVGKERCKLVLFHSLRRHTDPRQSGKSALIVGAIDPLPWAWPEQIPDRFIAQYAACFPEFP
ncbi:hypothetical protein HDU80_007314 [Chytriomyces hyalinus]|nr:hypothetical protein HDU80_007314 [Chytriomyces hyalinus]